MTASEQNLVERGLEQIVLRVLERMGYFDDAEVNECRRRLALINTKPYLKTAEAAFLLGCSENHLRNLVKKARGGKAARPIPFLDLEGTVSFPREALLNWAGQPKVTLEVVKRSSG
jgi:hypothetical protein